MTDSTLNKIISAAVSFFSWILILLLWFFTAEKIASPLILPSPASVFSALIKTVAEKKFLIAFTGTLLRCLKAFLLTVGTGLLLGFISSLSGKIRAFIKPFLSLIRSVPAVVFILIAMFWIKSSGVPVLAAFLMTLPVMTDCAEEAFIFSRDTAHGVYKLYGLNFFQRMFYVMLPLSYRQLCTGIKSVSGMVWKVVAAGEVLSMPRNSLGNILQRAVALLESQEVFAVTIVIIASSSVFMAVTQVVFKRLLPLAFRLGVSFRTGTLDYKSSDSAYKKSCNLKNVHAESENCSGPSPDSAWNRKKLYDSKTGASLFIKNLSVERGGNFIYRDFSLSVSQSERVSILAPSGTGKTTLLDFIAGLLPQTSVKTGEKDFFINDSSIPQQVKISYVTQNSVLIPGLTVLQNVALPLLNIMPVKDALQTAEYILNSAGLGNKINSLPETLSLGQKQRVNLARAFAYPADLILLDEAFSSVDFKTYGMLKDLFLSMQEKFHTTSIIVTHSMEQAVELSRRIICLDKNPVTVIFESTVPECSTAVQQAQLKENICRKYLQTQD